MKVYFKYLFIVTISLLLSCDDQGWPVKCADCFYTEPSETSLLINFDPYRDMTAPPLITLYEGDLEENIIIDSFSQWSGTSSYTVKLNKKYTITATYRMHSGKTYITVDSGTPRVRYEKDYCKEPCYFVYDKTFNLEIKYR